MSDYTPEQAEIKAYFIAERGYWRPWTEAILQTNPLFLKRYAAYAGHPARTGPLSQRLVELIYIALDASATHLYSAGARTHLALARQAGATPADVFDVLHVVAAQGLGAVYEAIDILVEEAGIELPSALSPERRERITRLFGSEPGCMAALAALDPGYLDVLLDFLEAGRACPEEGLAPTERMLIEIALNACFTGFNAPALRRCIRAALQAGVTPAEMLQAIQLGAHLSVHGTALGATLLDENPVQPD